MVLEQCRGPEEEWPSFQKLVQVVIMIRNVDRWYLSQVAGATKADEDSGDVCLLFRGQQQIYASYNKAVHP